MSFPPVEETTLSQTAWLADGMPFNQRIDGLESGWRMPLGPAIGLELRTPYGVEQVVPKA